jgi:hypothetical protein
MKHWIGAMFVMLSLSANVAGVTIVQVAGRVIDREGKPVAAARFAENWFAEQTAPLEPNRPAQTDTDGRFSLEFKLYNRETVVMAVDSTDSSARILGLLVRPVRRSRLAWLDGFLRRLRRRPRQVRDTHHPRPSGHRLRHA